MEWQWFGCICNEWSIQTNKKSLRISVAVNKKLQWLAFIWFIFTKATNFIFGMDDNKMFKRIHVRAKNVCIQNVKKKSKRWMACHIWALCTVYKPIIWLNVRVAAQCALQWEQSSSSSSFPLGRCVLMLRMLHHIEKYNTTINTFAHVERNSVTVDDSSSYDVLKSSFAV